MAGTGTGTESRARDRKQGRIHDNLSSVRVGRGSDLRGYSAASAGSATPKTRKSRFHSFPLNYRVHGWTNGRTYECTDGRTDE